MAAEGPAAREGQAASEKDPDSEATLKETLDKVLAAAEKGGVTLDATSAELPDAGSLAGVLRDWLRAFAGLCRESLKEIDASGEKKQRMILELVQHMLQKCPTALGASEPFVAVLRGTLCESIITNAVSVIPKVSEISLQIFVTLIKGFKECLKQEIGVFLDEIVLRILDSVNSTYHHKLRALQVLVKLCADPRCSLDLFLNFDCSIDEKNIVERTVDALSKIAQGKYTDPDYVFLVPAKQELELRMHALKGLVTLMGTLWEWLRKDGQQSKTTAASDVSVCEQKRRKKELQSCVDKFNLKPKRGIEHLRQGGFVSDTAESMAELFKNEDLGLDKTAVGDFLGEDKPFNMSVLDALICGLSFAERALDAALRSFLSLFRLPGEAQKISRIMEKFADKYCQDNPDKFSNTDCAFVLSFSLIMLQTDLHNPGVKNKMTKEQFINNNRGIDNGSNLPKEFLESLYDSVAANPMSLKEDDDAKSKLESQAAQTQEARARLFQKEGRAILSRTREVMSQKASKEAGVFAHADCPEHARPLFEAACWPTVATLSVLLEMHDEQATVEQCVDGFKHCVRIAVMFDMHTQRDTSVSTLAKFTNLTTIKEIGQKNIECLKALMAIGISEGNGLGPAWQYVLLCVSQLERLQIISEKSRQDHQYFENEDAPMTSRSSARSDGDKAMKRRTHGNGAIALMTMTAEDQQIELVNSASVAAQVDQSQIVLLFDRSERLDASAVVHFVTQLVRLSKEELTVVEQPRIFALQKLVEVATSNMSRPPEAWERIWHILSQHFIHVACHPNVRVGMYSVDSMRQLAKNFLENDQLSSSNLQAELLRPFEAVMLKDKVSREVQELIVSSISILAFIKTQNVKSGWRTIFSILYAAVREPGHEVAPEAAFRVMERILEDSHGVFVEHFSPGVRALAAFACQSNLEIALKAVMHLQKAAACLVGEKARPSQLPQKTDGQGALDADHPGCAHWFQILRALSSLATDPRLAVREAGLKGVVQALRDYGTLAFDEEMWRMVFKGVVKPLFEDVHQQLRDGDPALAGVVSEVVLRGVKDLSPKRFARCLPEMFPLLCKLVSVPSEEVRIAVHDIMQEQVQPLLAQAPATAASPTAGHHPR